MDIDGGVRMDASITGACTDRLVLSEQTTSRPKNGVIGHSKHQAFKLKWRPPQLQGVIAHHSSPCKSLMANKRKAFEIGSLPCSEAYVKDPTILLPAFEYLKGPQGPSGVNE